MGLGSILGGGGSGGGLLGGVLGGGAGGGILGNLLKGPMSMLQGMMNPMNMLKNLLGGGDESAKLGGADKAGKQAHCQKHDVYGTENKTNDDPNGMQNYAFSAQISGISNHLGSNLSQGFASAIAGRFDFN